MFELSFPLSPVPEVPLSGFDVFPPSGFVGFSTGVVTCPLSSELLEPSEHEENVNARLSARMQAIHTRGGGSEVNVKFHRIS